MREASVSVLRKIGAVHRCAGQACRRGDGHSPVVGLYWEALRVVALGEDEDVAVGKRYGRSAERRGWRGEEKGLVSTPATKLPKDTWNETAWHGDSLSTAERITEDSGWAEVDIRVVALSLAGRGAVKVPLLEVCDVHRGLVHSLPEGEWKRGRESAGMVGWVEVEGSGVSVCCERLLR